MPIKDSEGSEPVAGEGVEARGLVEACVSLDPFTPWLRFADVVADPRIRTLSERPGPREIEAIDTGVEARMDLEAVERKRDWTGALKEVRPMSADAYPAALEEQLRDRERQFILRNLGRAERMVDPDERLPFSTERVDWPTIQDAYGRTRGYQHERPRLLDETNLDVVRSEIAWRHRMTRELRWGERFGKEVKENLTVPMWKYDPDAEAERVEAELTETPPADPPPVDA